MAKEITRREFLKGAAAGALTLATVGALDYVHKHSEDEKPAKGNKPSAPPAPSGTYKPGTYSATAEGFSTLQVTMTFSDSAITDVVITGPGETEGYGKDAIPTLQQQLLDAQTSEIDGVSGASLTSTGVREAAANCIAQAKGEIPVPGAPSGEGESSGSKAAGWLGEAPEIAESDIAETWDTDFLIVGAGNGGMCAAAYAARHGVKFRVIEKADIMCRDRHWYGACDTEDMLEAGVPPMDRAGFLHEMKRFASGKGNLKLWSTWFEESKDMHKFIKEVFAQYAPDAKLEITTGEAAEWPDRETYFFPVEEHYWGRNVSRQEVFKRIVEEEGGVQIDFNTPMVKLERTENGKVTGVIAQNTETKKYIRINAAKGVLLACGGYVNNPDMMEQLDPLGTAVTTNMNGSSTDTGDGIKAAKWIGAAMQAEPAPMLFDRGVLPKGVDAGYMVNELGVKMFPSQEGQFNLGTQPFLKVNRKGQRFTNESGTYDMLPYAAYNQPGHVYAIVFDDNMPEDVQRFHTIGCSAQTRAMPQGQLDKFADQLKKGNAYEADTLEGLADQMGFTGEAKETFLKTCERYNELYDKQVDEDFGKPAYRLSALRKPPFRAFWLGACILTTEQGILCDEKARVIDEAGEVIPNLYVCGDNAGGFFVNNYPCLMAGIAMGRNLTYAIKAVKMAAGLDS